jgi:Na+-translocating ferredoxin:NAD+ oxidoreductase RnfE subunit
MKYPEIPEEVNVSKVMYGVNILIATSLVAAILVFLNGSALEERIIGLLLFIPPIVANSLAIANPEAFHYMWFGLYDIQKVLSIFFFIPAILLSLQL